MEWREISTRPARKTKISYVTETSPLLLPGQPAPETNKTSKTKLGGRHKQEGNSHFNWFLIKCLVYQSKALYATEPKGEPRKNGNSEFEIDKKWDVAEPDENIRADIARIYFYMNDRYELNLDKAKLAESKEWSRQDPVDERELAQDLRIKGIQGNSNPFIVIGVPKSW